MGSFRLAQISIDVIFLCVAVSTQKVSIISLWRHGQIPRCACQCYKFSLLQTGGQYFDEEQHHLGVPPLNLTQFEYAQYCYDATWTLAYALNQSINGNVCAKLAAPFPMNIKCDSSN